MSRTRRTEGEPHDALTRIGERMLDAMPDDDELRAVVLLWRDDRAATCLGGFDDDLEAVAAMLAHLRAIFEANGKRLLIAPLGGDQ